MIPGVFTERSAGSVEGLAIIIILGCFIQVEATYHNSPPVILNQQSIQYQTPIGYSRHTSASRLSQTTVQRKKKHVPLSIDIQRRGELRQQQPPPITIYKRRPPQLQQFFSYPSRPNYVIAHSPTENQRQSQYKHQNPWYNLRASNNRPWQYPDVRGRVVELRPYISSQSTIQSSLKIRQLQTRHQLYDSSNQRSKHFSHQPWNSPFNFRYQQQQQLLQTNQLQFNQNYRLRHLQELQRQRQMHYQQQFNRYYHNGRQPKNLQLQQWQRNQWLNRLQHNEDYLQEQQDQDNPQHQQQIREQTKRLHNLKIPPNRKTKRVKNRGPRPKSMKDLPQKAHLIQTKQNVLAKYDPELKPGKLVSNIVHSVKYVRGPQEGVIKNYWAYKGDLEHIGPEGWSKLYPTCTGFRQSPMNILDENVMYTSELRPFKFTGFDGARSLFKMHNNGHTASISVSGNMKVEGGGLEGEYTTANIHFHWSRDQMGSEHAINGMKFPLEMHVVNFASRYGNLTNAVRYRDGLAVFAVFFTIKHTDNPFFRPIEDGLKRCRFPGSSAQLNKINLQTLIPDANSEYYRYYGSLTTPPCHQSVIWTVFDDIKILSVAQIGYLQNMIESFYHHQNDNNNVQESPGQNIGTRSEWIGENNGTSRLHYPVDGVTHYITDNYRNLQPNYNRVILTNIKEYAGKMKFAFPNNINPNRLGNGFGGRNVPDLKAHKKVNPKTRGKIHHSSLPNRVSAMMPLKQYVIYY